MNEWEKRTLGRLLPSKVIKTAITKIYMIIKVKINGMFCYNKTKVYQNTQKYLLGKKRSFCPHAGFVRLL